MSGAPSRQLWLMAVVLAVLFTAFQIQSSMHSGALSLPATYDDVGYFNDALLRLEQLRRGVLAFLQGLRAEPPHAPLQTLLAMLGFGLLGRHAWAADAMNAIPLALVLRLFLGFATRTLPLGTSVVAATALLGFPMLGLLVLEFRPDMLCALLTAAGAMIVVADPRWRTGERPTLIASSALFVGALLAKPTLAPVTVVVFGVAATAVLALHSTSRSEAKRLAWQALLCGGVGAMIVLPYYLAVGPKLVSYVMLNAFGAQASIWAQNAATTNPAGYYLTGPGGHVAMGVAWLALAGVLLVLALPALRRSIKPAIGVAAVAFVAYASVTVPAMKSPFLGLIVPALVLCISSVLVVLVLERLHRHVALAGALCLLVFSVVTWRPVWIGLIGAPVPPLQSQNYNRIFDTTVDAIAAVPNAQRVYLPVIAQYLNLQNIEYELRRRGVHVPEMVSPYLDGNMATHQEAIKQSDVLVLFTGAATLPLPWPASAKIREEVNAAVDSSGAFETVATVDGGPYGGQITVLKRR